MPTHSPITHPTPSTLLLSSFANILLQALQDLLTSTNLAQKQLKDDLAQCKAATEKCEKVQAEMQVLLDDARASAGRARDAADRAERAAEVALAQAEEAREGAERVRVLVREIEVERAKYR